MHTEVYANHRPPAQTEPAHSLKAADNYLNLLPEHRNEITNQWLSHVVKQRISGNGMRILHSIYRHTIGFNKQKDDLSGKRLQQIAYIRADHANHTLRVLEADHAIICKDGRYGQIVSINFDFASWGKKHCKENQITPKFISDPRTLLPKYYRDEPIDTGNIIGASLSEVLEENIYDATCEAANAPHIATANHPASYENSENLETLTAIKQNQQIIEKLVTKLDHLEDHIQTLQTQISDIKQKPPQYSAQTQASAEPPPPLPDNPIAKEASPPPPNSHIDQHSYSKEPLNPPCNSHPNSIDKSENLSENAAKSDESIQGSAYPALENLRYPKSMDQFSRNALQGLLFKAKGQAQNILDLLAIRLENTQNPIKDIALYCGSLVRKAQNNTLDLDSLDAYRASQKPAPNAQEQHMQQLQEEYQDAEADYQHFKHINELQAKNYQCSVEKYLKDSGMEKVWEGIVNRLEQVKTEITRLQG